MEGGYEDVPTRDIRMHQNGYQAEWVYFLETYVRPLQEKVFPGHFKQVTESERESDIELI